MITARALITAIAMITVIAIITEIAMISCNQKSSWHRTHHSADTPNGKCSAGFNVLWLYGIIYFHYRVSLLFKCTMTIHQI